MTGGYDFSMDARVRDCVMVPLIQVIFIISQIVACIDIFKMLDPISYFLNV